MKKVNLPSYGSSLELWNCFRAQARSFPSHLAVSTSEGEMTFGDLFRFSEETASALSKAGVQEGSLVALALPNSLEFVTVFLSLCKLGIMVALISPQYGRSEMQAVCDDMQPLCILARADQSEMLARKVILKKTELVASHPSRKGLGLLFRDRSEGLGLSDHPPETVPQKDIAVLKVTSGSTGKPKGIALSAKNVLAEAGNVTATLSLTPEDRILAPVPVCHSYGFSLGVLAMLFSGAALVLEDSFVPRRILTDLSLKKITVFLGVPVMYRVFLETSLTTPPELKGVRYLLSCTAPLDPATITRFYEKYRLPICQHYGSSETGSVTTNVPSEVLAHLMSVGVAMPNVEVKILGPNGEELKANTEGEVVVSSLAVAHGYVMGQPPGESPFRGGAYWTGDIGLLDEKGFLYVHGRKDQIINVGGVKVSPYEVQQVLESFPAVREAAVAGVKDAFGEQVVYAVVSLRCAATEEEILEFCRTKLADYKVPRRIDIRAEIPRGPSGKIQLKPEDIPVYEPERSRG